MWSDIYEMLANQTYCWQKWKENDFGGHNLSIVPVQIRCHLTNAIPKFPQSHDIWPFLSHPKAIFISGASDRAAGALRVHLKVMFVKLHWMNDRYSYNLRSTCWQYTADI